jgi:general secretion pathway protein G
MMRHFETMEFELGKEAHNAEDGLTILELMVVLVILSLIAVVGTVQVVQQMDRAKGDVTRLQLRQVESALELFQLDMRRYPTTEEGLVVLLSQPNGGAGWRGPYLKGQEQLKDPWGNELSYSLTGDRSFVLGSWGADGSRGGEGPASDIDLTGGV